MGRGVVIRAELRAPAERPYLRWAVGRVDPKSPIGLSRQCFFEDLPHVIEALIELYQAGAPEYVRREHARIRENARGALAALTTLADRNADAWHDQLATVQGKLIDDLR